MRMTMKCLIPAALASVAVVAVSGTPNISFAQAVSDTLTTTITRVDSRGTDTISQTTSILQSQEPASTSQSFNFTSGQAIILSPSIADGASDTLTIFPFTVTLTSDGGPEPALNAGETLTIPLIRAESDPNGVNGQEPSDRLTLFGLAPMELTESNEPGSITATFSAQSFGINEPGGTCGIPPVITPGCSDILAITLIDPFVSSFTATLFSSTDGEPVEMPEFWT